MATFVNDYTALITSDFTWNHATGRSFSPEAVFLTYSFADSKPPLGYGVNYENQNFFRPLTDGEKAIFREAINIWSSVSGITFFEVASGLGDVEGGAYDLSSSTAGQASLPHSGVYGASASPMLYAPSTGYNAVWLDHETGMDLHTMLHEIGHRLGLEHPHDGSDPLLSPALDNGANTVMSYNNFLPRLGTMDVQAIQALYGTPAQKGSNVASWSWNAASQTLTQTGSGAGELLHGTGTHDIIYAAGGRDIVVARSGNDTIFVSGNTFQVAGGTGFDTVHTDMVRADVGTLSRDGDMVSIATPGAGAFDITMFEVERVMFKDAALAYDFEGIAGQAYRLYRAAFARTPDEAGLGFWIRELDKGTGDLLWAARGFMGSAEFATKYGQPSAVSNDAFISVLYRNVLNRDADTGGFAFWNSQMGNGMTRDQILAHFSESPENKANVAGLISDGIWYGLS